MIRRKTLIYIASGQLSDDGIMLGKLMTYRVERLSDMQVRVRCNFNKPKAYQNVGMAMQDSHWPCRSCCGLEYMGQTFEGEKRSMVSPAAALTAWLARHLRCLWPHVRSERHPRHEDEMVATPCRRL
eukprot:scaffold38674_cov37-Prasinocladus_malaysianus.AAC.1